MRVIFLVLSELLLPANAITKLPPEIQRDHLNKTTTNSPSDYSFETFRNNNHVTVLSVPTHIYPETVDPDTAGKLLKTRYPTSTYDSINLKSTTYGYANVVSHDKSALDYNADVMNEVQKILNKTKELCPYSSYCGTDPLFNNTDPIKIPCCKDCKCDLDCGRRGDCCHTIFDRFKFQDKFKMSCISIKSEYSKLTMSKSYKMVDKCSGENFTSVTCSSLNDNKWINMLPVYSPSVNLIFYNKFCALCNDILDAITWNSFISCQMPKSFFSFHDVITVGFQTGKCGIDFQPPAIMPEDNFQCFESLIDRCNVTEEATSYSELTETACRTISSPVRGIDLVFANAHCMICNNRSHFLGDLCSPLQGKTFGGTFTFLLDTSLVEVLFDTSMKKQDETANKTRVLHCDVNFIKHPYANECRPLLCPNGQYRLKNKCHFFSKSWYLWGAVSVTLLFTVKDELQVSLLENSDGEGIVKFLQKKKLHWKYFEMLYSVNSHSNETTVNSIMVQLAKETGNGQLDLANLVKRLQILLHTDIVIDIEASSYKMKLNIDRGIRKRWKHSTFSVISRESLEENNTLNEVYYPISTGRYTLQFGVPVLRISKLFFCPMVKLYRDDYKRTADAIFFRNETEKRLFPGEYHFSQVQSSMYICAEDFNSEGLVQRSFGKKLIAHKQLHCAFGIILVFFLECEFCF